MSDALLARLEAAVARLEKIGGSAGACSGSGSDDADISPRAAAAIADFDAIVSGPLAGFVAAANAYPDLKTVAELAQAGFSNQAALLKAAAVSKKPSDADLLAFLKPSADAISKSDNMNYKSEQYVFQQAFNAGVPALSWPFALPAHTHVETYRDAAEMYLNKILVKAKDAAEDEKSKARAYVAALRALLNALFDATKAHCKAGINWNPKGAALGSAPAATAAKPAAAAAAPAAAAPAAGAKPAVAGLGAVFGEISKGLAVTSGLRKVTADMKTKNRDPNDVAPIVAPPAAPLKPSAPEHGAKVPAVVKPPVLENKNSTWYCENYVDDRNLEIKDVSMRDNVFIGNCRNTTVRITGKAKSVQIDRGFRTTVYLASALSSVEFVNSDRCVVYVEGSVPTIAIDKSKGIIVNLSESAVAANPDIVTSNISECNVQIPGDASKDEDLCEIAIPEQYINKLNGRKITSNPVSHG